jgi:K+-dependent Na+/Ca+ exchanger-like protein
MTVVKPASRRPTGAEYQKLKNKTRLWFRGSLLAATFVGAAYMGWKNEASLVTSYNGEFDGIGPRLDSNELDGRRLSSFSRLSTFTRRSLNATTCNITTAAPDAKDDNAARVLWQEACCSSVPVKKTHLKNWLDGCSGTVSIRGKPYLSCLEHWHQSATECKKEDGTPDMKGSCSYFAHCSDMRSYPAMAVNGYGGGVVVYLLGLMYMFAGLAIVCDEYFVPALEVLTEKLDVSDDVAGATLMAAGGSAPELATSTIGLFVARTDVGFTTIVGSAVFNVLFVIGMCAMFSKDVLVLTGWPITRDSLYYSLTLLVLACLYRYGSGPVIVNDVITGKNVESSRAIEWWECMLQFFLYLGYVTLMKFNQPLKTKFYAYLAARKNKYKQATVQPSAGADSTDHSDDVAAAKHRHADGDIRKAPGLGQPAVSFRNRRKDDARKKASTRFRVGVLDLLMGDKDITAKLRIQAVAGFLGDVRATFNQFDTSGDGKIDEEELGNAIRLLLGFDPGTEEVQAMLKEIVTDESEEAGGHKQISFDEFERWYEVSEYRVQAEMHNVFTAMDTNNDGRVGEEEFKEAMSKLDHLSKPLTEEELAHGLHLFAGDDAEISFEEFSEWYKTTILYTHQLSAHKKEHIEAAKAALDAEEEEDEGVDLSFPDGMANRIVWLLLLPITGTLYMTVPDVRWPAGQWWCCKFKSFQKFYVATFFLSIAWIAVYSFFMVWWAIIVGDFIGIPQEVMGLVVLAAGTSVPDLITSVIVAREGHGDMAVSSSIGSNIFDVTVGLPLPWILHNFIFGPVQLSEEGGLFFSLLLLLFMLLSIIITIIVCKFRMTRSLGITMFALYVVFLGIELMRTYEVFTVDF